MYKKLLIVFEGIEGSGKSTHINIVANYLKKNKYKFIKLREPGGTKNSEKIRKLILNKKSNFNHNTDLLLYLAARSENIEKIILKNYKKKIILIDRFTDSTIAYQHYGMKINKKLINFINKYLLKGIKPDITFLNLIDKKNLIKRLKKRRNKNRYDLFRYNFYKNVQRGYLNLSKKKSRYVIINSNKTISENKEKILNKITYLLK